MGMNDERVKLPAERRRMLGRSFSSDSRICDTSAREENYGFSRKTAVVGSWTARSSRTDLLHHPDESQSLPPTPRRFDQMGKADSRFQEMVDHMNAANPEQRMH